MIKRHDLVEEQYGRGLEVYYDKSMQPDETGEWVTYADHAAALDAARAESAGEVERLRVQLAGCLCAAEGNLQERPSQGDYGWSLSYERTVELRQGYEQLRTGVSEPVVPTGSLATHGPVHTVPAPSIWLGVGTAPEDRHGPGRVYDRGEVDTPAPGHHCISPPLHRAGREAAVSTPMLELAHAVFFEYRNHRGVHSARHVVPVKVWFGVSPYHDTPQWFLHALDLDKDGTRRDFAMKDISHWGQL